MAVETYHVKESPETVRRRLALSVIETASRLAKPAIHTFQEDAVEYLQSLSRRQLEALERKVEAVPRIDSLYFLAKFHYAEGTFERRVAEAEMKVAMDTRVRFGANEEILRNGLCHQTDERFLRAIAMRRVHAVKALHPSGKMKQVYVKILNEDNFREMSIGHSSAYCPKSNLYFHIFGKPGKYELDYSHQQGSISTREALLLQLRLEKERLAVFGNPLPEPPAPVF